MRPTRARGSGPAGLLIACLLFSHPALAAMALPDIDRLSARAADSGSIRVIVQLAVNHQPAGRLDAAQASLQSQDIQWAQQTVAARVRGSGARELHRFRHIPFILFEADAAGIAALGRLGEVVGMQEDIPERPALAQSAPIIGAPTAWGQGADGAGQVVAVLDTGVDLAHPFFSAPGKIVAEACFSTHIEGEGIDSLCPGQATTSLAPGSGDACPADVSGCDHGTHVAGIAVGNDGVGPDFGIAPAAGLIPIQVNTRFENVVFPPPDPPEPPTYHAASYPSDQIRALEQLYDWRDTYPIAAVNLSLGGGYHTDETACDDANVARKAAIDNLRSVGIPAIIASGNQGHRDGMMQPGCISSAISVGATDASDNVASFSNIAPFIELLAPGVSITSAALGGGVINQSGTSMATPHVAGAWAVLRQAVPGASLDQILAALIATGTLVDDDRVSPAGTVTDMPRINLDLALAALQSSGPVFSSDPVPASLIDFGTVAVAYDSPDAVIDVSNTGDAELSLACGLSGADAADFVVVQCEAAVPALAATELRVRCHPGALGPRAAVLDVTTNDPDNLAVSFDLACEGVTALVFEHGFEGSQE